MRRKKRTVKKRTRSSRLRNFLILIGLFLAIPFTLYLMQDQQIIRQNAQTTVSPPFFCAGNCPTMGPDPSGAGSARTIMPSQGAANTEPCPRNSSVEDYSYDQEITDVQDNTSKQSNKKHTKKAEGSVSQLLAKLIDLLEKLIAQLTGKESNPSGGSTQKNDKPKKEKPKSEKPKSDKPCKPPKPSKSPKPSKAPKPSKSPKPSESAKPSKAPQTSSAPMPSRAPSVAPSSAPSTAPAMAAGGAPAPEKTVPAPPPANTAKWDKVAQCESGGKWNINTGNGYSGGLQFSPSTWKANGGAAIAASAHLATKEQQIQVAERVLKTQGKKAWPKCGVDL